MKTFKGLVAIASITLFSSMAQAYTVDFINITEKPAGLGESAWNPLHLNLGGVGVDITGHSSTDNDITQYSYLDWNNGGLGVCKDLHNSNTVNQANPLSGGNLCSPASDDNVTKGEYLTFKFDKDVVIANIWFNNNHDGGFDSTSKVNIDGTDYSVSTGFAGGANGIGSFNVAANTAFNVAYVDDPDPLATHNQFYISGIQIPEPSTFALFGMGLLALGFAKKAKKS